MNEMCGIKMYCENSYKELQVVKAKRVLSEKVPEGCVGTVVYVHSAKAYEVEFVNSEGATLEVLTVEEKDIMPVR